MRSGNELGAGKARLAPEGGGIKRVAKVAAVVVIAVTAARIEVAFGKAVLAEYVKHLSGIIKCGFIHGAEHRRKARFAFRSKLHYFGAEHIITSPAL